MLVARASLPQQYQQLPDEVLFHGILDQLIQQTALADSFDGDLPPRVTLSLENESRSLTAGEAIEGVMAERMSATKTCKPPMTRSTQTRSPSRNSMPRIFWSRPKEEAARHQGRTGRRRGLSPKLPKKNRPAPPAPVAVPWVGSAPA